MCVRQAARTSALHPRSRVISRDLDVMRGANRHDFEGAGEGRIGTDVTPRPTALYQREYYFSEMLRHPGFIPRRPQAHVQSSLA